MVLERVSHCNSFRMNRMSGEILSLWKYPANYTAAAQPVIVSGPSKAVARHWIGEAESGQIQIPGEVITSLFTRGGK